MTSVHPDLSLHTYTTYHTAHTVSATVLHPDLAHKVSYMLNTIYHALSLCSPVADLRPKRGLLYLFVCLGVYQA